MKSKTVIETSIFPASKEDIFNRLKELKTLQYVAAPLAAFSPVNGAESMVWQKGGTSVFHFKLFDFLPLGLHTIHVVEFDEASHEIYTNEANRHIREWNHRIILEEVEAGKTRYTDEVEIRAGWKTPLIYLWAKCFYKHRHKRWITLLRDNPTIQ